MAQRVTSLSGRGSEKAFSFQQSAISSDRLPKQYSG
jgi:hypothetical protein